MRLQYNSPVILTYTLTSLTVLIISTYLIPNVNLFFRVEGHFSFTNIWYYPKMVTHVIGHANWQHFIGNFSLILLIGPMLEEKYGPVKLIQMIFVTAFITGLINIVLFDTALLGASGIVFMLIILSSFSNYKEGHIPLTFILVVVLYIGNEVRQLFANDQISQSAHIIGGICGAIFGFIVRGGTNNSIEEDFL